MALEPLFNISSTHPNRVIDQNWTPFPAIELDPNDSTASLASASTPKAIPDTYLGIPRGEGILSPHYGDGEYLDLLAIQHAQLRAVNIGTLAQQNLRYLPIQSLRLGNIVVDGLAFERWFNPSTLNSITFKGACIDAGFYLGPDMKHTTIIKLPEGPEYIPNPTDGMPAREVAVGVQKESSLKIVDLQGGKVVNSVDAAAASAKPAAAPAKPASALARFLRGSLALRFGGGGVRGKENKPGPAASGVGLAGCLVVGGPVPVGEEEGEPEEGEEGEDFFTAEEMKEAGKGKGKEKAAAAE
jgi:hypothetical protein